MSPTSMTSRDTKPASCTDCHDGKAVGRKALSPGKVLAQSVHSDLDCTACHESMSMEGLDIGAAKPHGSSVEPVNCGACHEDETAVYKMHGRTKVGDDPDIPTCWDCHGTHDIFHSNDRRSHVHPSNQARTCMACHTNPELVKKHDILRQAPIELYEKSIHGRASRMGIYVSATCNDCHSSTDPDGKRTAHRILGPADTESTIYHFNIPDTCGRCHQSVTADYWDGIHGALVKRGEVDSPICTTCHGEHGIFECSDPRSPVNAANVAERTCSPCHESVRLNEKYGIPGGRLASYVDSYHGHKAKAGDVEVANCASCHGAHRILPSKDPTSSIYPANLQKTCGRCHPGISPELAQTGIHTTATGLKTGWPAFFRLFYLWMISITIGLMLLHNVAHYVRHIKQMRKRPFVVRLTINETMQHWVLMSSFIVLVISGFALRFSDSWWAQLLFGWGDGRGFEFRGLVHRIAAVVMIFSSIWHVFYLFGQRGRHMIREMILSKRDLVNIVENAKFFLGLRHEEARHGRFTYMEKCEYWALVWGAAIMTGTGILLVFDNFFTDRWGLPKGVLDVMLVIHYYEAWLATLAIFVWHIYGTIFSPTAYPMNPAWIDGRMPKAMHDHEHPAGPILKGRVYKSYIEDDTEEARDEKEDVQEDTEETQEEGDTTQTPEEDETKAGLVAPDQNGGKTP
ncbi:MAG: cytochrome b/b6 domain-containing protein [Phycisphaerae bacterium]|nr:cytochrome b/b6 domain-containing protein [Phycisphaerae bacterium]